MRKIEIYFMIAIFLWVIVMAITPVGGWSNSNLYHEWYIWSFCITGGNCLIAVIVMLFNSIKIKWHGRE